MSLLNDLIAAAMQLAGTDDQVNHNARFCETHGRDEVAVEPDGSEYCNECAADGWSGELCHPSHESCDMLRPNAPARRKT